MTQQKTVHITLQGKGGCGKSLITSLIAQYLAANVASTQFIDTDPVNRTFSRITNLGVTALELLNDHQQIDPRQFDTLVDMIIEHDGHTVIDTGASVFVPFKAYLHHGDTISLLLDHGVQPYIHVPLIGNESFTDTANGLQALIELLPDARIVAWNNPHFGAVEYQGRGIEQSRLYLDNRQQFAGIVNMMATDPATFGQDIAAMQRDGLTYQQAINHPAYSASARHRLKRVWAYYCTQLGNVDMPSKAAEVAA